MGRMPGWPVATPFIFARWREEDRSPMKAETVALLTRHSVLVMTDDSKPVNSDRGEALAAFCLNFMWFLGPATVQLNWFPFGFLAQAGAKASSNSLFNHCLSVTSWSHWANLPTMANLRGKYAGKRRKGRRGIMQSLMQLVMQGWFSHTLKSPSDPDQIPVRSQSDPLDSMSHVQLSRWG